ncbi:MAG: nucleoside deaminase [Pseudomonadota bacterium]
MPQDARLASRLLSCLEREILPATEHAVAAGNKIFGAALLRRDSLETVLIGTNNETACPLWHGEVHTIKLWHERLGGRPGPGELLFLSTHEPCSMCLSAIAWAGFPSFHYFFSHEDSRDAFAIPHDLRILAEVFGLRPGGYRRSNAFWNGIAISDLIAAAADRNALQARAEAIRAAYAQLSARYQAGKEGNRIPLR